MIDGYVHEGSAFFCTRLTGGRRQLPVGVSTAAERLAGTSTRIDNLQGVVDTCKQVPYTVFVIGTYASKAPEVFAAEGDGSKLPVQNHARVRRILLALDAATKPEDMNLPGFRFHGLNTKPKRYAVDASGNYRVTWAWDDGDAIDVSIEDYH